MTIYSLHASPAEVVRLIRAEIETAGGQPELHVDAWQDYVIDQEYAGVAYKVRDGNSFERVAMEAVLTIEPRLEENYWILSVVLHKEIEPKLIKDPEAGLGTELTLEEFEQRLLASPGGKASVSLECQTPQAKQHFDTWWAALNERYPLRSDGADQIRPDVPVINATDASSQGAQTNRAREVAGVFANGPALESATDDLESSGLGRSRFSVLCANGEAREHMTHLYQQDTGIRDGEGTLQTPFASRSTQADSEAVAVAPSFLVDGLAGAAAVVAFGGALAIAIGRAILAGTSGTDLGSLLTPAVAQQYVTPIMQQLTRGGLALWIRVDDADMERQALTILRKNGAQDVHVYDIQAQRGPRDHPLPRVQTERSLGRESSA